MSLSEALEELRNKLKEGEAQEEEKELEEETEAEEEAEAESEEEKSAEPEPKEEPKPEEEKLDNAAYARLRREAAAAKKAAEEEAAKRIALEQELEKQRAGSDDLESDSLSVDDDLREMLEARKLQKAAQEFQALESSFAKTAPDYAAVSAEYAQALFNSLRIQNPRAPESAILEQAQKTILYKAAVFAREGFNPIEELYHEAKELGFTGKSVKQEEPEQESKSAPKPDMKKVAANRARSAGMAAGSGKSEGSLTKEFAATQMTIGEWQKLPPEEKKRLMFGA